MGFFSRGQNKSKEENAEYGPMLGHRGKGVIWFFEHTSILYSFEYFFKKGSLRGKQKSP